MTTETGTELREGLIEKTIPHLVASKVNLSVVVSGGAFEIAEILLSRPGASKFVNEVVMPYSKRSLELYLGEELGTKSCVSKKIAAEMAEVAYMRSKKTTPESRLSLGVSCTAAIKTDRKLHRGARAFVGLKTVSKHEVYTIYFGKDRTRKEESNLASCLVVYAIQCGSGYKGTKKPSIKEDESLLTSTIRT